MSSNRFRLNPSKTKFLWYATSRRIHQIDDGSFHVSDVDVKPSQDVRNLGVMMDGDLSMTAHVNKIISQCFYLLRKIKWIRSSLSTDATVTLVTSLICSRIDYCNTVFAGLPNCTIDRLQSVLHAAARIIMGMWKYDHIIPTLRDELHWLPVMQRITFKLWVTVY